MVRINSAFVGKGLLHLRNKIMLFDDQSTNNEHMSILTLVTFLLRHTKLLKTIETLSFHWSPQGIKMVWHLFGVLQDEASISCWCVERP